MSEKVRMFAPGEEAVIALGFEYEGGTEIESVEALFVREGSGEEVVFLVDARREAFVDRTACYAARLETRIDPNAPPGEYRCARLSAHDKLDVDWDFDAPGPDLVLRVERIPLRLEASEFL